MSTALRKPIELIFVEGKIIFFAKKNANERETFANKRETFRIYTCKRGMFLLYQYHFSL